jgi:hypothetical protein
MSGSKWRYYWSVDRPLPTSDKSYQQWMAKKNECFDGKDPFYSVNSQIAIQFEGEKVIGLSLSRIESTC